MSNSTSTALSSGVVASEEPTATDTAVKPARTPRKGDNSRLMKDAAAIYSAEEIRLHVGDIMARWDAADRTITLAGQELSYFIMCQHAVDVANAKKGKGPVPLANMWGEEHGKPVPLSNFVAYLNGLLDTFRNGAPRIGKPSDKLLVSEAETQVFKVKDDVTALAFKKQQAMYNRCSRALALACILAKHKVTPFDFDRAEKVWNAPVPVILPGGWEATGALFKLAQAGEYIPLNETRWAVSNMTNETVSIYASVAQVYHAWEHQYDKAAPATKADAVSAKRGARPGGNTTTATATPPATSGTTTPVSTTTTVTPVVGATPTTGSVGNLPATAPKANLTNLRQSFLSSVRTVHNVANSDVFNISRADMSKEECEMCERLLVIFTNIVTGAGQGVIEPDKTPPAKSAAKSK